MSAATNLSMFGGLNKRITSEKSTSTPLQQKQPCKKCAKIRNSVKKFFRSKFETEPSDVTKKNKTSLTEQPNHVRMHIVKDGPDAVGVIETHQTHHVDISGPSTRSNTMVCFGCDQPEREPSTRGQPIISPVCHSQVSTSPLGEIFKNHPERVKKPVKIDRPRSLGPRKRIVDKDQPRETSVHEARKPSGR